MLKKLCASTAFLLLVLTTIPCSAITVPAPYWAQEIDDALVVRDDFVKSLGLNAEDFFVIENWSSNRKKSISYQLTNTPATHRSWEQFTSGILSSSNKALMDNHFSNAIAYGRNNPGILWLLCTEFMRAGHKQWAEKCLELMEGIMVSAGAKSAPLISQQLIQMGRILQKEGQNNLAAFCYDWASRFDHDQVWSHLLSARLSFPAQINHSFSHSAEAVQVIIKSWRVQHSLMFHLFLWVRNTLFIFAICILILFSVKYLPNALHVTVERLFPGIPFLWKTPLSLLVFSSFISFGFVPLFWILSFLLFRLLKKNEKTVLFICCVLMTFLPLGSWIQLVFSNVALPVSTPALFTRVSLEGHSPQLHQYTRTLSTKESSNHLAHLSGAISSMKSGDMRSAATALDHAVNLNSEDPLVLLALGNFHFMNGRTDRAITIFSECMEKYPGMHQAKFNLAQCHMENLESVSATDLINELSISYPLDVNNFIKINDRHFAGDWPLLRKMMQPEITSGYFWSRLFYNHGVAPMIPALAESSRVIMFLFSSVLLLLLFLANWLRWSRNKVKEIFICNSCGRITCKICRMGTICQSCHKATKNIHSGAALDKVKHSIVRRRKKVDTLVQNIISVFIPGADKILKGTPGVFCWIHVVLSCSIISAIITISNLSLRYPNIVPGIITTFIAGLLLYNIFYMIKHIRLLFPVFLSEDTK